MTEVEYDHLEAEVVGKNKVAFKLEDGTEVIVYVDIARAGKRIKPDGKPDYHVEFANRIKIKTANKKFKVRKRALRKQKNGSAKGYTI